MGDRTPVGWGVGSVGAVHAALICSCRARLVAPYGIKPSDLRHFAASVDVDCLACGAKYRWYLDASEVGLVEQVLEVNDERVELSLL